MSSNRERAGAVPNARLASPVHDNARSALVLTSPIAHRSFDLRTAPERRVPDARRAQDRQDRAWPDHPAAVRRRPPPPRRSRSDTATPATSPARSAGTTAPAPRMEDADRFWFRPGVVNGLRAKVDWVDALTTGEPLEDVHCDQREHRDQATTHHHARSVDHAGLLGARSDDGGLGSSGDRARGQPRRCVARPCARRTSARAAPPRWESVSPRRRASIAASSNSTPPMPMPMWAGSTKSG